MPSRAGSGRGDQPRTLPPYYLPLLPCLGLAAELEPQRLPARPSPAAALALLLVLLDIGVTVRYLALFAG